MVHKNCAYGDCKSDSRRNRDGVCFYPFPKSVMNLERCLRWIKLSGRVDLTVERVSRYTYICSKHFIGGNGPTAEHPDPLPFPRKISRKRRGIYGSLKMKGLQMGNSPVTPKEKEGNSWGCSSHTRSVLQRSLGQEHTSKVTAEAKLGTGSGMSLNETVNRLRAQQNPSSQTAFLESPHSVRSHIRQMPLKQSSVSSDRQNRNQKEKIEPNTVKYIVKDWGNPVMPETGFNNGYTDPEHPCLVLNQMFNLWKEQKLCDAAFIVDGTTVPFHRLILAVSSSHMKATMEREDLHSRLEIQLPETVTIKALYCFLNYLYTGSLNLSINSVQSVLRIASILKAEKAVRFCKKFIETIAGKLGISPTVVQPMAYTVSREEENTDHRGEKMASSSEILFPCTSIDLSQETEVEISRDHGLSPRSHDFLMNIPMPEASVSSRSTNYVSPPRRPDFSVNVSSDLRVTFPMTETSAANPVGRAEPRGLFVNRSDQSGNRHWGNSQPVGRPWENNPSLSQNWGGPISEEQRNHTAINSDYIRYLDGAVNFVGDSPEEHAGRMETTQHMLSRTSSITTTSTTMSASADMTGSAMSIKQERVDTDRQMSCAYSSSGRS